MEDILRSERDIEPWLAAAQTRAGCSTNQTTMELLEILQSIDQPLRKAFNQLDKLDAREDDRENEEFLDWISAIDYEARYEEVRSCRMNGTGKWLLDDKDFMKWQSSSSSSLLWLSGISE